MALLLLLLALAGHAALAVALLNRMHTLVIPERVLMRLTLGLMAMTALLPLGFLLPPLGGSIAIWAGSAWLKVSGLGATYVVLCWLAAAVAAGNWLWCHALHRPPAIVRWHRSWRHTGLAVVEEEHHRLTRLPGNQSLVLDIAQRGLEVERLPPALEGLRIVHLSDLHFSGAIGKSYFQEVVRASNEFAPDLTLITGDVLDNDDCVAWIPDTLGRLQSRYGVYYVLGNHDRWIDAARLCQALDATGARHLGGRWQEVAIRDVPVLLAGNELPWFPPAADLAAAPVTLGGSRALRIVLSHSPDQLAWARAHDVDLLLAGHTHGGQIRLPGWGAVLTPSRQGVRYAWGTFHAPPTVMHVTRGISARVPLRVNCAPELCLLVLHGPSRKDV